MTLSRYDYTYRLKPMAGDSAPHNEVDSGSPFTGGTIALQNNGAAGYAWRFSASPASAPIPSYTQVSGGGLSTEKGATVVLKVRVIAQNAYGEGRIASFAGSSAGSNGTGLYRYGTADMRFNGGVGTGPIAVASVRTYVIRTTINDPARYTVIDGNQVDGLDVWVDTVGRSGSTPDRAYSLGVLTDFTYTHLVIQSPTDEVLDVYDAVFYPGELSNADCAALADDINAALAPPAATLGGNVTLDNAATGGGLSSVSSSLGGAVTLDDIAPAGTLGAVPGRIRLLGIDDEWRNKAGTLLASKSATVDVHSATTGSQLARITTATDAGGLLPELSHGALSQSTLYRVDVLFGTGEYGVVYRTSEAT